MLEHFGEYELSDDPTRLDLDRVCALLATTYWADTRPREIVQATLRRSLCFGLYHRGTQVGMVRAVTDGHTFAWICDVVIDAAHRGHGVGKWMLARVFEHPEINVRRQILATRDAHALYERYGFRRIDDHFLTRGGSSAWTDAPKPAPDEPSDNPATKRSTPT